MIFRQLFDPPSSTYTYLLADERSRHALLVDPVFEQARRDTALIEELGLKLQWTLETHVHADFISGDVTVRGDLERALENIDTIVHLAAETGTGQSMYEIERYYRVNVQGTALLFDILANTSRKVANVVLASSRSVYGEGAYAAP